MEEFSLWPRVGERWFQDDSRALYFLCTLILVLLYQLHLRLLGIGSLRLETPVLYYLLSKVGHIKNGCNSLGGDGLVAKSRPTLVTLWIVAHQTLLLMGFPRQDYRRGLPFSSPGDFANSGVELTSPALQLDTLLLSYQGTRVHHLALSCFNLLTIQLILDLSPKFQCSCSYDTDPVAL